MRPLTLTLKGFTSFKDEVSLGFEKLDLFVISGATGAGKSSLLDAMTNGGLGVAWFWPWSDARYFMPFHPIAVSPIGLSRFLSERGLLVLQSEARWVWLPCLLLALAGMALRFLLRRSR